MMELIYELKLDGESKGLCRLWNQKLKSGMGIGDLVELYIKGIDFCISMDFPTLEFMKSNLKGKCEPYGVYIDDADVSCVNKPDMVLNGSCEADLRYTGYSVSRLYIRHDSKADIVVEDNAMLTIDAFDGSSIKMDVIGNKTHILVNLYGNACIECSGDIRIRKMNKETY